MDSELARLIADITPPLNPDICNGLAMKHLKNPEVYIDEIFRAAGKGFPVNLVYKGYKRCTPTEEFAEVARRRAGNKRIYDLARSDIYMVRFHFTYNGEELPPQCIYLPFVGDGGSMTISGSKFNITPTLTDKTISVGATNIFVRLLRAKLTFERLSYRFITHDGTGDFGVTDKQELNQVVWSKIYNKQSKGKRNTSTVKAQSTLVHYLFCKYGLLETFNRFGGCTPVIGTTEITPANYPATEWCICYSATEYGLKPKSNARSNFTRSNIRIAIRKEELTPMVRNLVGGFYYVLDLFPTQIMPEYIGTLHETQMWKFLLGLIIQPGIINRGKLCDEMTDHMNSLDEYLDDLVKILLKEMGIHVNDIYQLFGIIINRFNELLLTSGDNVASMWDKEISILPQVLFKISSSIFMFHFKLLRVSAKKQLTGKEITAMMKSTIKPGSIFFIRIDHPEVISVSTPGDNKATKITSILAPPAGAGNTGGKKARKVLTDVTKRLHASIAEVGGYLNLPKASPDGRARINPHVTLNHRGGIVRNLENKELLDDLQSKIKR